MRIKVEIKENFEDTIYEMFKMPDGKIVNCGGRFLPF